MKPEVWDWDEDESDGYNYLSALEVTLINFKIIKDEHVSLMDDCRKFARKWSAASLINVAKQLVQLKETINELTSVIDVQNSEIYNLKKEMQDATDGIWSDVKDVRSELSQDINTLEGAIDSVSNSLDDVSSEVCDLRHDVDKNTNEIEDITSNLADRVLLD